MKALMSTQFREILSDPAKYKDFHKGMLALNESKNKEVIVNIQGINHKLRYMSGLEREV